MFTSHYDEQQKKLTCNFEGNLDTRVSLDLSSEVSNAVLLVKGDENLETKARFDIVFNLQDVTYIASSFIRICVSTAKQTESGRFAIINAHPEIRKTFVMVGLESFVK